MPDEQSSESEPEEEGEESESEEGPAEEEEAAEGGGGGDDEAPAWSSSVAGTWDANMQQRMQQRYAACSNRSVRNAGEQYAQLRATPFAPRDGWYDERYRCETLAAHEIDEERDFEFILGDNLTGIPPPRRVSFAMKGLNDDMVEFIARFLDETATRYGDQVKAWREEGEGVKQLYLNDNPITDVGAAHLADALKNNQTVEELYLHYCNVNDKGVAHFLEMLKVNKTLKKLELGANGVTEKGVQAIIKAFEKGGVANKNVTLEHLGLFNNADSTRDDLPTVADFLEPAGRKKRGGK